MRFHLIDRVDAWEPAKWVRARKVTSLSEDYWEPDGDALAMPDPLILEALCQAGTWLIMITTERRKRAALLSIGSVEWLRRVRPGDVLDLEGEVDSFGEDRAVVSGRVSVDGEPVLVAGEIMCALIDAEDLADLDDTRRLQDMLTRGGGSVTRVVITGLGAVTPIGNDAPSTWAALRAGRSGVGPITTFDASTYPVRIAGLVDGFELTSLPEPRLARHLSRAGAFGVAAALEALRDADVADGVYDPPQRGLAMGASVSRPALQELSDVLHVRKESDGHRLERAPPSRVLDASQSTPSAVIARIAGCGGPVIAISTACTASLHAIGEACRRIQDGETRLMLAGGYDALTSWVDVLGFSLLGALTQDYNDDPEHASRPFERDRTGFVLAEGAVAVALEELDAARARGATIYAELAGYSSSLNAYRMTDPPPDGGGAAIAMAQALRESGLAREQIDYVVAHGTGTPAGDRSETVAIKRLFEDHSGRLAVSSPKSMTGHTTCAAGGVNLLAAVYAMRDGVVSPTINYDNPDPELDLDYIPNEARELPVRAAMVNAFAFGGTNGALVVCDPALREAA